MWEINGISLQLDFEDAETLERYEQAFNTLEKTEFPSRNKPAEFIRAYCKAFRKLYDDIFDYEVSKDIFKNIKDNSRLYDETFESFLDYVTSVSNKANQRRIKVFTKYSPKVRK